MHQLKKGCKTSSVDRLTCFVGSCRRKFNQRRNFTRHLSLCHKTVSDDLLATHDFCRCRCNNIFSSDGLALHLRRCKAPVAKSESPTVEPTTEPPLDESPLFDLPPHLHQLVSPQLLILLVHHHPPLLLHLFHSFLPPSLPSSSSSIPLRPSPPTGPEQLSLRQSSLDIFTDGSYSSVTKTAGFGVFYSYDDKESRIYGPSASTHNCAEFEAVVVALQSLKSLDSPRRVTVFSDSSLVVDALNLKARLREKRLAVFYNRIFALLEDELLKPFSISFKKIQAHNHNAGNDEADRLAKLGASGLSSTDADLNTVSDRPQDNPVAPEVAPEFDLPAPDSVLTDNSQKCFLCPLTFARTRSLCTHIDRCHPEVDQDTLLAHGLCRCPACPKVFSTRGFDNHWKTHSSGEQQSFIPELSPDTLVSLLTSFASLPYRRLEARGSWNSVVSFISTSSLSLEQKCRFLMILPVFFCSPKSTKASSRTNTKRVRELISDNELSRALSMLSRTNSSCSLTKIEVLEELNRLHPRDESLSSIEVPESTPFSGFPISSISNAALSSPATEGGISHWHAKLLKPVLSSDLLKCLQYLTVGLARGSISDCLRWALTASRLSAIPKSSRAIRPIAVGELFYRISAKVLLEKVNTDYLISSNQFGVKVPGGAETVIHSIRGQLGKNYSHCIQFDISNAFNEADRSKLVEAVSNHCPRLLPFLQTCYLSPSALFHSGTVIYSERESNKVTLLALYSFPPFLLILSTPSNPCSLTLYYCLSSFSDLGLRVNEDKTEVHTPDQTFRALGAYIGPNAEQLLIDSVPSEFNRLLSCLDSLSLQEQLLLVRICINTRIGFIARVHPPSECSQALSLCHQSLLDFLTIHIGLTIPFPELVSLPVSQFGGLGLTNYQKISSLCHAASLFLAHDTLNKHCSFYPLDDFDVASAMSLIHPILPDPEKATKVQALLTLTHNLETLNSLVADFPASERPGVLSTKQILSPVENITALPASYCNDFLMNCKPLAHSSLVCLPTSSSKSFTDDAFRYFLKARLLSLPLVTECPLCTHSVSSVYHSANCEQLSLMRIDKHDSVIRPIASATGLLLEQPLPNGRIDLLKSDSSEGYDLTLVGGHSTSLSVAVSRAKKSKISLYSPHVPSVVPLVAHLSGGLDPGFVTFLPKG
ncbi:hypothetical protein GEMRC1_012146 [Eukaryota sp. GEM-RC1]